MARFRPYLSDLLIVGLFLLLPLILFWPQTIGGRTLLPTENLYQYEPHATYKEVVQAPEFPHNHLLSDLVLQNYQWKSFIREQIAAGEVPLWNPHQFGGIPFLAAGQQSALYPLSLVYYVMPLPAAYGWFTVLNLWLAGCFMFAFMRGIGVGRVGGAIAGVTYQLCGFFIASVVFPMIIGAVVWLPLLLLMAEFVIRRQVLLRRESSLPWVVIGAAALGCNILAGHVEITIYTLLILAYYAAVRLLWAGWRGGARWPEVIKSGGWLVAMVALGFGLGAVQFIPLYEFVSTNWRAERSDLSTVLGFAHPVRDVIQFAVPNFYGSPAHHHYFDVFALERLPVTVNMAGEAITHTEWGIKNYVEGALYLGIFPLVLAVWAGLRPAPTSHADPQPPHRLIFGLLTLVALTFMFGLPTYAAIYVLPGINQLNSPFRWIFGVTVGVAVLAGFGADALTRLHHDERLRKWARRFGWALVAGGVLVLAGLLISRVIFDQLAPIIEDALPGLAGQGGEVAADRFSGARMFYSYQFVNLLVFGLMALLSGVIFLWASRDLRQRRIPRWAYAAVALVAVDLMIASWGFNPASDPLLLDFTPQSVQWLQTEADDHCRYTTLEDTSAHAPILQPNMTLRYGLDDIRGYDSIIPAQYVAYMRETAIQPQLDFNRIAPLYMDRLDEIDWERLNRLNVCYIVTHISTQLPEDLTVSEFDPTRFPPQLELAYETAAVRIWRNNGALPRVYLAEDPTPDSIISTFGVSITQDSGREKFIDLDLTGVNPQWLIVSETYRPGWRAYVRPQGADTERELDVELVLENFQGVRLDPNELTGQYTLRMVYSPTNFQVGLFGSVISAALLAFVIGVWVWRLLVGGDPSDEDDGSSTVSRVARNSVVPIILNLFNRGIDFAFAFVMLRILGPEQAGIYYYAVVVFVWFDILTNFGLDVFLIREASRQRERSGYVLVNTSVFRLLLMFVCVPVLLGFILVRQSAVSPPLTQEALLAIGLLYIGLAPASLNKGLTSLFYAFEKAEVPAAVTTITTINKTVLQLIALLLGFGIVGLAGASIIVNFITLGILFWAGRGLIRTPQGEPLLKVNRPMFRTMTGEGWPLMLNHFLATIFFQIDIVLLEMLRGATIVGKYSVSYRWLLALNIIPAFFTQALLPVMSRQASEDKAALKRTYTLGIKLLVAVAVPCAVAFLFLAYPLTLFLGGTEFLPEGAIALQIMIWSIPIGWINSLTQYTLIALDLQRRITRAFVLAVTFNIVSNALLIPVYGYRAAAVTTILSEMVLLVPFGLLLHGALGRIPWVDMIWRPIVAGAVMLAVLMLLWPVQPILALLVGGAVYPALLLALRPLNRRELEMLTPLLPGRLKRFVPA